MLVKISVLPSPLTSILVVNVPKFLGLIQKKTGLPVVSKTTTEEDFIHQVLSLLNPRPAPTRTGVWRFVPKSA